MARCGRAPSFPPPGSCCPAPPRSRRGEGGPGGGGIPWGEIAKQAINFAILSASLVYFLRKPLSSSSRSAAS